MPEYAAEVPAPTPTPMHPRHAAMLDRILGAAKLETQLTGSGGRAEGVLNDCLRAGWAKRCDHPTVTDRRDGYPADAIAITLDGMRELEVFQARRLLDKERE